MSTNVQPLSEDAAETLRREGDAYALALAKKLRDITHVLGLSSAAELGRILNIKTTTWARMIKLNEPTIAQENVLYAQIFHMTGAVEADPRLIPSRVVKTPRGGFVPMVRAMTEQEWTKWVAKQQPAPAIFAKLKEVAPAQPSPIPMESVKRQKPTPTAPALTPSTPPVQPPPPAPVAQPSIGQSLTLGQMLDSGLMLLANSMAPHIGNVVTTQVVGLLAGTQDEVRRLSGVIASLQQQIADQATIVVTTQPQEATLMVEKGENPSFDQAIGEVLRALGDDVPDLEQAEMLNSYYGALFQLRNKLLLLLPERSTRRETSESQSTSVDTPQALANALANLLVSARKQTRNERNALATLEVRQTFAKLLPFLEAFVKNEAAREAALPQIREVNL